MTQRVSFCRFRGARVAPDDRAGRWGATHSGSRARPVVRARSLLRAHATTDMHASTWRRGAARDGSDTWAAGPATRAVV